MGSGNGKLTEKAINKKIAFYTPLNFGLVIAVGVIVLAALALNAAILALIIQEPERFLCDVTSCPLSLPQNNQIYVPLPGNGPILICHNPGANQIEMLIHNNSALEAHLEHGDGLGGCSLTPEEAIVTFDANGNRAFSTCKDGCRDCVKPCDRTSNDTYFCDSTARSAERLQCFKNCKCCYTAEKCFATGGSSFGCGDAISGCTFIRTPPVDFGYERRCDQFFQGSTGPTIEKNRLSTCRVLGFNIPESTVGACCIESQFAVQCVNCTLTEECAGFAGGLPPRNATYEGDESTCPNSTTCP